MGRLIKTRTTQFMDRPLIKFRTGFLEIDEYEMPLKGYRNDILVSCPNGKVYELCFYDPVRLSQDMSDANAIYENGLVIIKIVTKENIESAVQEMWEVGFFDKLKEL